MEKMGNLWDEFTIFGNKGIRLEVFDDEKDPESDSCLPDIARFHPKPRQAAGPRREIDWWSAP